MGDDSLVFCKLLSANRKSDGKESGHGDWDTTDEKDKNVVKPTTVLVSETGI
jgi:hypothetical protein